jgi:NDP-sugar pyrophosphorylase family protein
MKAMVFAAGLGSRLGGLTKSTPKCLMTAGGKTMLELVLEKLQRAGVDTVVINLYYLAEKIEEFLQERSFPGLQIELSHEPMLLGTGGGLQYARRYFEGEREFIIHNSDVYSDIDLGALVRFHRDRGALASLAVMNRPSSRVLLFNSENSKEGVGEVFGVEADLHALAFTGIQVVSSKIFSFMKPEERVFSTIEVYLRAARAGQPVICHRVDDAYWIDIGKPAHLRELQQLLGGESVLQ